MRTGSAFRVLATTLVVACFAAGVSGRAAVPSMSRDGHHAGGERESSMRSQGQRRLALVVGNDRYSGAMALQNARRDAKAIATELGAIGFTTTLVEDATRARLIRAIETLAAGVGPGDIVLFYYAGHGAQVRGINYLLPVDYAGRSEEGVELEGISATQVQTWLQRAQVSILVLDACRNNPYSGTRSAAGGLAPMEARGSLVAFATGAGQTASDNPGGAQGTFTGALLETLKVPGLPVRDIFFRVRQRVFEISRGQQFPAVYDGLIGDVILRPAATAESGASSAAPPLRPGPPAPSMAPGLTANSAGVPTWLVGDFRGTNLVTKANVELTVHADGTITGTVGVGGPRVTPVRYEWVGATGQIRDPSGAYVFDLERRDDGFRTSQVGSPSNTVDYQRVYLPPGSVAAAGARGYRPDATRVATPDELAALFAVIIDWKAAWETADDAAGRAYFPSWSAAALRAERAKAGAEKVSATVTCNSATVRRDQARVQCRASITTDFARQLLPTQGSRANIGQRPSSRTQAVAWVFTLFWNGSTWLIESHR